MGQYKVYEIKQSIFKANDDAADVLRAEMKREHCFLLNLMSSPGSGKTTTLTRTIEKLGVNVGVYVRFHDAYIHFVAELFDRARQGLTEMGTDDLDLVVLENVGNLVCPAEFDTGAAKNAMILSVPEGHDKPLKYPLIFQVCDALIINKIDVLPYFDFDMDKVVEFAKMRNPNIKIFPISAKTGEGVDEWCAWLREQADTWNAR